MCDNNKVYPLMEICFGNQRCVNSDNSVRKNMSFFQHYSNQNYYKLPNFEDFDHFVQLVATDYIGKMSQIKRNEMRKTFKKWKSEPNKLNVNNMYNSASWRAIYTQQLFLSRMQTVEYCIRNILQIDQVKSVLETVTTIASIGCGPGPDIASTISILRSLNLCHHISVVGIDQFDGWQDYINSMNSVDDFTRITFQKMKVDENSVKCLDSGDMCLMSYTDAAIHTSKFWKQLKRKYKLILILDQNNSNLFFELKRQNFKVVKYCLKGNKQFSYFLQKGVHKHKPMPNKIGISCKESRNASVRNLSNPIKPVVKIIETESINSNLHVNLSISKSSTQQACCNISSKTFSNNEIENQKKIPTNKFFHNKFNNLDNFQIVVDNQKKNMENNSFKLNVFNNEFKTADYANESDYNITGGENSRPDNTRKISLNTYDKERLKYENLNNNSSNKITFASSNVLNQPLDRNPPSSSGKSKNRQRKKLTKLKKQSMNSSIKPHVLKRLGELTNSDHISSFIKPCSDNYTCPQSTTFCNNNYYYNYQQTTHLNSNLNNSNLSQDTFNFPQISGFSNNRIVDEIVYYCENTPRHNSELNYMFNQERLNNDRALYNYDSNLFKPAYCEDYNLMCSSFSENYPTQPIVRAIEYIHPTEDKYRKPFRQWSSRMT